MQVRTDNNWLLNAAGLVLGLAILGGCQMEPNMGPAPEPFVPKDLFSFFPSPPKREYTFSEEAAAIRPDPLEAKDHGKSN
jgi:hypothetical protein